MARRSPMSGEHLDRRDISPFDVVDLDRYWLAGARVAYRDHARASNFSPARPTRSTRGIRTCRAIAPKGGASMPAFAFLLPLARPRRGSRRSTCARTNICCSLGRPEQIVGVSYLSQDPQEFAAVAGWRGAYQGQPRIDRRRASARPDDDPDHGRRRPRDRPARRAAPASKPSTCPTRRTYRDVERNLQTVAARARATLRVRLRG